MKGLDSYKTNMTQAEANEITRFIQAMVVGSVSVSVDADDNTLSEHEATPGIDWEMLQGEKTGKCPVDGEEAWHNTGISAKNNKPYENLKCTKNEKHIYWRDLR